MSGSPSKNKGKSWERDFANFLSELYGASFIRVPSSGAYVGGKNAVRKTFLHESQIRAAKGDIVPPGDWKHFNCEAKNYGDFPFHQLTKGNVNILETWIEQCLSAADPGDYSFLVIKVTHKGTYIVSPQLPQIIPGSYYFSYKSNNHGSWYLIDYETFWKNNKDTVKILSLAK
jgi:Holliday junction resolvase